MSPGRPTPEGFRDRHPDEMRDADLNPYVKLHRSFGPPVITADEAPGFRGRWEAAYGRPGPLHVEVGSGNGFFLTGMAQREPSHNWLGIELRYKRVVLCARKIRAAGLENARIARFDAFSLDQLFAPDSLAGLYVNHPDPWPKKRQQKNRLIAPQFLAWVSQTLMAGAELRLKTDFEPHIDALVEEVENGDLGLRMVGVSRDIRTAGAPWPDDFVTNYQSKFDKRGEPVFAASVCRV